MNRLTLKLKPEKTKLVILEIFMIALAILMAIPIYYLLVTTLKTPEEAAKFPLALPKDFRIDGYTNAWKAMEYPRAFTNNLIITSASVTGIILLSAMAAYPVARRPHKLHNILFFIILAGIMVPYQMAIIPLYKLVRTLKLMNSLYGVILIDTFINVPFAVFLFRGFIRTIPYELEEAAHIDGCSLTRTFWQITFPLLKPVVATVAILDALTIWNDFMTPLLFLHSREKDVILQEIHRNIGQFSINWTDFFPMMMLGVAPLLIFYIFMQKYIIKGIASGSIKG